MVVGALPGHRGVVAAANYRAREFGIHSAMPIAEAYLDLTGLEKLLGPPEAIGREIKRRIQTQTDLTVSVGIGPNRADLFGNYR